VSLVQQELLNTSGAPEFIPWFWWGRGVQSLVFCVMFCSSLFVLLSFLCWSVYFPSFDWQLLITFQTCRRWSKFRQCARISRSFRTTRLILYVKAYQIMSLYIMKKERVGQACSFVVFSWPLYCLSLDLRLLITPLSSSRLSW
jgi:hypothetical protein